MREVAERGLGYALQDMENEGSARSQGELESCGGVGIRAL